MPAQPRHLACFRQRALAAIFGLWLALISFAAAAAEHAGVVDSLVGSAFLHSASSNVTSALSVGTPVDAGDTLTTDAASEVVLRMDDGGVVSLRNGSSLRIDEYLADGSEQERSYFSLIKGAVRSVTGWIGKAHPAGYRISTPTATIGIRGTDHEVVILEQAFDGADEPGTYDIVHEGATYMQTALGEVDAVPGLPAFFALDALKKPLQLRQLPAFQQARKAVLDAVLEKIRDDVRDLLPQLREDRKKGLLKNIGEDKERKRTDKLERKRHKLERDKQPGDARKHDRFERDDKRERADKPKRDKHGPRDRGERRKDAKGKRNEH